MNYNSVSHRSRILAIILCCVGFVGLGGLHRLYVGKLGTGIIWLLTGGLLGIGTIVDLISLIIGTFTDNAGFRVIT